MSVAEIANCTVTVLRGTTSNQFGDTIDANTPVLTGVPAFIAETGKTTQDPSTPTPRVIRQVAGQIGDFTGLLSTDRLMRERDSQLFIVLDVTTPDSLLGAPVDLVLSLKRVS